MLLGDPSNPASPSFSAAAPASHRSYIPSLIPPGVDPAKVDSKMFYTYVPNTIKTRKRTTPAQLEILEGVFVTDKKPNAPRRKELAKKLKMSPREVQVWFQNRRAKEKKSFAKKDPSPTSPTTSTSVPASAASTGPHASIATDGSPSPDAASDVLADPVPPQSGASPVTKIESETPEPSPRASQSASWQSPSVPSPPNDSFDQLQQHHAIPTRSPPEASPAAYGLRRSSLPVLSLIPPQEAPSQSMPSSTLSPHVPQPPPPQQQPNYHLPPSFPSAVMPPHMLHHRRSTGALPGHPYALPVRRPSATHADYPPPSGPPPGLSPPHAAPYMRASISEGMDMPGLPTNRFASSGGVGVHGTHPHHSARFHPFQSQSRRPNLAHRASVPALFHAPHNGHTQHLSASQMPMPSFPPTPTSAIPLEEEQQHDVFAPQQQQDAVLWNNPDPFGTGAGPVAIAPDAGYSFGMPPSVGGTPVVPASGYEFPERKPSVAPSDPDTEYTFTMESGVYRRSAGSVVSLYGAGSDAGTTASTGSSAGPYFSDVTSEGHGVDEDGRRGSCVSTSEMLSRLHVGGAGTGEGNVSPSGAGSDGYTSEHGTLTYPSPTSDCERVNMSMGVGPSSPIPPHPGSSELALALHSNESSPYTPPPAFKYSEADMHATPQLQVPHEYPPYSASTYVGGGGGEYSHHHVNGYPPAAYPNTFDGADGARAYPPPGPSPADDYAAATRYT